MDDPLWKKILQIYTANFGICEIDSQVPPVSLKVESTVFSSVNRVLLLFLSNLLHLLLLPLLFFLHVLLLMRVQLILASAITHRIVDQKSWFWDIKRITHSHKLMSKRANGQLSVQGKRVVRSKRANKQKNERVAQYFCPRFRLKIS